MIAFASCVVLFRPLRLRRVCVRGRVCLWLCPHARLCSHFPFCVCSQPCVCARACSLLPVPVLCDPVRGSVRARRWEACESSWRTLRHDDAMRRFTALLDGPNYVNPPSRLAILAAIREAQTQTHNSRLQKLRALWEMVPPGQLVSERVETLKQVPLLFISPSSPPPPLSFLSSSPPSPPSFPPSPSPILLPSPLLVCTPVWLVAVVLFTAFAP